VETAGIENPITLHVNALYNKYLYIIFVIFGTTIVSSKSIFFDMFL